MRIDFLAHLLSESARFADVLAGTDPGAPVPSCPEWTAADLLWHLAEVQLLWGTIVRERLADPGPAEAAKPARPDDYGELLRLYGAASSMLADAIAATRDDVPVWTWFAADQSAGFIRRRQAHEALIHRLDAELTAGAVTDVDVDLATDGVAEVLEWMYSGVPEWAEHTIDGPTGAVVTTDTERRWLVRLDRWSGTSPNTARTYVDEPSLTLVPDGATSFDVSGAARDLDAWLWNRPTLTPVVRNGDCAAFEAVIRSGVQ
jgi:uncharacterized protein (TIGR03083 family)